MNMEKTVSVAVTALTMTWLLGATCFASPTRAQVEGEDNACRAHGITVAYYDDAIMHMTVYLKILQSV